MKKLLKIVLGLLVTLILLALAVPMFISADTLKKELIAKASEATGRKVEVGGKASLTLFPNIAVSVEDVTIGNPAGYRAPYLIRAKKLATGAALMPLLHGNLNVTGITLEGADIQLEQLASGAKNWEFTKDKVQDKAAQAAEKNAASSSPLKSFALGDISVKDSAVTYIKPGKVTKVDQIDLTVKGADALSPLSVDGSLRYQGKTAKLSAKVDQLKNFLEANHGSAVKLDADLPGASIKFSGTAAMDENIAGKGSLALVVSDPAGLVAWASGTKPAGKLPKSIDLKGNVTANGMKYGIKDATLKVDDLNATGDLAANLAGAVPAITGSLKFGMLDFDRLLNTADARPVSHNFMDAYAAEAAGWSNDPLNLAALKSVNADLHLAADALKFDKLNIGNTALHTVINGGALTTTIEKAALYGGSVTGTINASAANTVGADIAVSGVQIEPLLNDMNGSSHLRGTTSLKFNLKGSGASERAIVSNLNGNGSFEVRNGAIKGINLAQFWREAKQGFLFGSPTQATDFTDLSATFTVVQGLVSNSDLAMKSPALYVSGKGTVNLPPRTVNYVVTPSIGASGASTNGFNIPLNIIGSIDNPNVIPDVKSIIQEQLKNPEQLKNTVKSVKENIGKFNSPKDLQKGLGGLLQGLVPQQQK